MQFRSHIPLTFEDLTRIHSRLAPMANIDHKVGKLRRDNMIVGFGQYRGKTFRKCVNITGIRQYCSWCRNRGCKTVAAWTCPHHQVHLFISYVENYLEIYDDIVENQEEHNMPHLNELSASDIELVSSAGVSGTGDLPSTVLSDADLNRLADLLADRLAARLNL
jgi:NADH:ubiquinone oxidoreductase subunit D